MRVLHEYLGSNGWPLQFNAGAILEGYGVVNQIVFLRGLVRCRSVAYLDMLDTSRAGGVAGEHDVSWGNDDGDPFKLVEPNTRHVIEPPLL